ncbi:hypothetical protein DEO72_LG5g1691 [Vigna unguiculata]|uniref:Uncharacterized protein n=1 Tax=Vigna unguiculata TaxID=3917 RepID=A0A4D6M071_VIGUN|nr:hypothetical protein DEO72_LG5g1691 [Vigna unguiculata]
MREVPPSESCNVSGFWAPGAWRYVSLARRFGIEFCLVAQEQHQAMSQKPNCNVSLELWLGIGVKNVVFLELWLKMTYLELWLGLTSVADISVRVVALTDGSH